jgi:hypothetical protein
LAKATKSRQTYRDGCRKLGLRASFSATFSQIAQYTSCELLAATNEVRVALLVERAHSRKISNQPLWMFEVRAVSASQVHR